VAIGLRSTTFRRRHALLRSLEILGWIAVLAGSVVTLPLALTTLNLSSYFHASGSLAEWWVFLVLCQIALGIGGLVTLYPARDARRRGMVLGAVGIAFLVAYLPVLASVSGRLTTLTVAGVEAVIAVSLVRAWLLVRFSQGR
jgi:hypothetical protein